MKIVKVNSLPQTYEADTVYIVKSSTSGLIDIYVTNNTGSEIRTLPNDSELINSLLPRSEVGMTVASLVDGKIPTDQLPPAILGALSYQGTWNASTNVPAIPVASPSNKGWYYVVNTAGTSSVGGVADWEIGDWVVSSGTGWGKIDNSDKVSSVAGKTGAVTLTKSDVGLGNVDNTSDANKAVLSATKLATPRTINGVNFNGTANISVPVGWSDVTGKPAVIAAGADKALARAAIDAVSVNEVITPFVLVTAVTQPAVAGVQYGLNNTAATTLTLPASPLIETLVWVVVLNNRNDNVLARNGSLIGGLAEDMTIDNPRRPFAVKFIGGAIGWTVL